MFLAAGLAGPVQEVPCTLESGESTTCLRIARTSVPSDHAQGPWCPKSIHDGPEAGGIWPEAGVAHEVTGEFVANLATFYEDSAWAVHNEDGTINVTDSAEKCAAAARPDVDPDLHNHCVECLPTYLAQDTVVETLIPKVPTKARSPSPIRSNIGLALNGVEFAAPAPTHAILAAHTLAPFDDCGGHINMHEGYHYHAVTSGCLTSIAQGDAHAPMIGYALDGFPIHARAGDDGTEPIDLDECRGHADETRGYHYHVAGPGKNQTLNCFTGEIVEGAARRPPGPRPDQPPPK
ncbi:YHYH protein [Enhygromyxa salina]|uniref:YHYH protein n=1 Tax=Enhygromyxa salina TaxID=215803 RepID=UPI0015E5E5B2|nr:YHYH protein [Enhygromyxa salina]